MKITVKYFGVATKDDRIVAPICPVYAPTNSYVDTAVFVEGNPDAPYGKSIYATNVTQFGRFLKDLDKAMLQLPFPGGMKMVNMLVCGEEKEGDDGRKFHELVLEVADYKEQLYFKDLAALLDETMWDFEFEEAAEGAAVVAE